MASLVLGVVGAVVGSLIAPGIGTAIGWSLGSALGGLLDPPKSQGPRLSDLKLQGSSYGSFIGIPYGTIRLAGDVIWQTDLTEHSHTEGGKGGPEVTTFTYTASFAIQICEGPVAGVFKVWADGRLVLSVDEFGARDGDLPMTVYLGTERQLPDPTIEAIEGIGNVPAHRGYCYVVFTDLELGDYGNRIPSFTFEVSTAHGHIPWRVSTFENPNSRYEAGPIAQGAQNGQIENGQLVIGTYPYPSATGSVGFYASRYSLDGTLISVDDPIVGGTLDERATGGTNTEALIQCQNNYHIAVARLAGSGTGGNTSGFYYDGVLGIKPIHPPIGTDNQAAIMGKPFYYKSSATVDPVEYLYGTGGNTSAYVARWPVTDGVPSSGSPSAHYFLPGGASGWSWFVTVDENGTVWVFGPDPGNDNGQLFKLDADLNLLHRWRATDNPLPETVHCFVVFNNTILFANDIGGAGSQQAAYYINDDDTFTLAGYVNASTGNVLSLGGGLGLTDDGIVSVNPPIQGELLSFIVGDISERCGLANSYNVEALTDVVDGFLIGSQMGGRAAIETLMPVYFFDGVESDALIKFVKRGGESVATIDIDELAAMPDGGTYPAPLETIRSADAELPAIVNLTYLNQAADYQSSTQTQRRQTGGSQSPVTLEVPVVMSDAKAKQVTDALLFHPWLERNRRSFRTSRKYLALEPTDVVTVEGIELRLTQKKEGADGVIEFGALPALSSIFSQPAVAGTSSGFVAPTLPGSSSQATQLLLLDIPLVDDDDAEGFYVAMAGTTASWRGGALYRSSDGGASYTQIARTTTADIIGSASTVLGDFLGGDIFDELNTVTVVIGAGGGTLSSTTALAVMNGANKALLGKEILQYRDATLTAASTYRLSGLLRGRRGTEWAIGTHGSSEQFVALPTGITVATGELNISRLYKGVTIGGSLASATATTFANTGSAIRPYSVVHIGGGFNGGGDCLMTWIRRTRIGAAWSGYVDVPLSEASELYTVEVWDSAFANLKRTISGLSSPAAIYTAAQQTADFGSPQSSVYVKIYQNGRYIPSRGVRAHFPSNSVTWTSDLEPTPGAIPPPAALRTIPFDWSTPGTLQAYSADWGGFAAGDSISISFTTPASTSSGNGRISIVEFTDPPVERAACFSTVSGDFDTGLVGQPQSKQIGIGISFFFTVGAAQPYMLQLAPSTTYYLNLRNGVTGYASCNIQVTLQKPSGL